MQFKPYNNATGIKENKLFKQTKVFVLFIMSLLLAIYIFSIITLSIKEAYYYHHPFDRIGASFYAPSHLPRGEALTNHQLYVEYSFWPFDYGDWSPHYHGTDLSLNYKKLRFEQENNSEEVRFPYEMKDCDQKHTPKGIKYCLRTEDTDIQFAILRKGSTRMYFSYRGNLSSVEWSRIVDSLRIYKPKDIKIERSFPNMMR